MPESPAPWEAPCPRLSDASGALAQQEPKPVARWPFSTHGTQRCLIRMVPKVAVFKNGSDKMMAAALLHYGRK